MNHLKKTALHTLIASNLLWPNIASAVVCNDPVNTAQLVSQQGNDVMLWFEEKALAFQNMTLDSVLAEIGWQTEAKNEMAQAQAITSASSETANLEMAAKYQVTPTLCDSIASATNIIAAIDDGWCGTNDTVDFFNDVLNDTCHEADSDCEGPNQELIDKTAQLVKDATGADGTVDSSQLSAASMTPGLGGADTGYSKTREETDAAEILLQNTFLPSRRHKPPTNADGTPINAESSPAAKKAMAEWLKRNNRYNMAYTAAVRVNGLTDTREIDGADSPSILQMLVNEVDRYNSPEMIKKYGNGEDKSCLVAARSTRSTEEEMESWRNTSAGIDCMSKFTSTDVNTKYITEMTAVNMQLNKMILNSSLSTELLTALQAQVLIEMND